LAENDIDFGWMFGKSIENRLTKRVVKLIVVIGVEI